MASGPSSLGITLIDECRLGYRDGLLFDNGISFVAQVGVIPSLSKLGQ